MSEYKLSNTLQISVEEAKELITKYFTAFPKIHSFLTFLGNYGTQRGFILTYKPFTRVRWFEKWTPEMKQSKYITDKEISKNKGEIERQSKNTPIQGTGANMIKLAMVYIRLYSKRLPYPVKLVLQIHDDIVCEVPEQYAKEWSKIQERLMKRAAKVIIKNLEMKCDITISKEWKK